ncbi:hypothetical protein ABT234_21480 [Streptomyces sp. NPDC001586]|uniref:hypothetical protein n=1 Tax=Streptomyces sp. NPDC001586 TaxID=3154387 RepID=UPI0033215046
MEALKATDVGLFELARLRLDMERSQRAVERLARREEALHDLLAKREAEVSSVRGELDRLRLDWTEDTLAADRRELELRATAEEHASARETLLAEIARLRAELAATAASKAEAEKRCRDLEDRVLTMEEELAGLRAPASMGENIPIAALVERLQEFVAAGDMHAAGRELVEVARSRPVKEIHRVLFWLARAGEGSRAALLLRDVVQLRTWEVVLEVGDVECAPHRARSSSPLRSAFFEAVARFRSVPELADAHQRWSGAFLVETVTRDDLVPQLVATPSSRSRPHRSRLEETVLVKVIAADRPWSDALELIGLLQERCEPIGLSLSVAVRLCPPERTVPILAELARPVLLDRADDVDQVGERLADLMAQGPERQFTEALLALPVDERARLLDRMATVSAPVLLTFLNRLDVSGQAALLADALIGRVRAVGRSEELRRLAADARFLSGPLGQGLGAL